MLEAAWALALILPEMLKSSVLMVKGDKLEELAVELPIVDWLKSISEETLAPLRDWLKEPKKSRSRSTRRRLPDPPAILPL